MAFSTYWSTRATRRFQGFARISTMVCQVARYLAANEFRNQTRFVSFDESPSDEDAAALVHARGERIDPTAKLVSDQLYRRAEECLGSLPAKRLVVAKMVWLRQIHARRVAEILRVSEAAISQHLKLAREVVGNCLKMHGFHLPS
jgi:RNA polymerase sigma factor (sigma-70 family)